MKKSMALMFCGFLTLLLTACGSGGGGAGSGNSAPSVPVEAYVITAVSSPTGPPGGTGFLVAQE